MGHEIQTLWDRLHNPEYLYLIYSELSFYGIFFCLIFLILALVLKTPKIQLVALGMLAVCALLTVPHLQERKAAQPQITSVKTPGLNEKFKQQTDRREQTRWVFYALAALAVATLALRQAKVAPTLFGATVLWASVSLVFSAYLHMRDAEIHQPNIMLDPPEAAEGGTAPTASQESNRI